MVKSVLQMAEVFGMTIITNALYISIPLDFLSSIRYAVRHRNSPEMRVPFPSD
jgi:hypothetical protein